VGLRAGLDMCGKSRPTGIRSPDRPARRQSLYRLINCIQNINGFELALEPAECHTVVISQQCNFMPVNFMYVRILIS
jgi:hypothetical protein